MNTKTALSNLTGVINKNPAFITLVILILIGLIISPNFLTEGNISAILFEYSVIGFLALGQLLVILTGGFDLAQGSMLAFTSIIVSVVMSKYGLIPSVISGLLFTTFLGFISGVLVSYTKMPPFIATLGMMGIVRALAMTVANAKPVPINNEIFALVGNATIFGIPFASFLFLAVSILLYQLLKRRRLGRYIYAVGSSEQCAILSGIKIKNVKLFVYTMSAFLTAVGAFIWCARLTSGSPIGGSGYEMRSIAAVAVGGADLFGGQGTVFGTFAGVFIFGVIGSIINFTQIPPFWQGAFNGIFILLAVIYSVVRRSRKTG